MGDKPWSLALSLIKVHLIPKFFSPKKIFMLWWVFLRKTFWVWSNGWIFMPRWSTDNRAKIAAILAHDRISKIKGLATTVTSLQEPKQWIFVLERLTTGWIAWASSQSDVTTPLCPDPNLRGPGPFGTQLQRSIKNWGFVQIQKFFRRNTHQSMKTFFRRNKFRG